MPLGYGCQVRVSEIPMVQLQAWVRSLMVAVGTVCLGLTGDHLFHHPVPSSEGGTRVVQPSLLPAQAQADPIPEPQLPARRLPVLYVPTPPAVVDAMLKVADVKPTDVVYDLGSGDGRIVIAAAQQRGARGVGVDIDPLRVEEATENARKAGVSDRVQFRQQDLFQTDLREATVVTLYLLPELNLQLRPKLLRELKPGSRIVSHAFSMGDWKPDRVILVDGRVVYYWVVPEKPPTHLQQPRQP